MTAVNISQDSFLAILREAPRLQNLQYFPFQRGLDDTPLEALTFPSYAPDSSTISTRHLGLCPQLVSIGLGKNGPFRPSVAVTMLMSRYMRRKEILGSVEDVPGTRSMEGIETEPYLKEARMVVANPIVLRDDPEIQMMIEDGLNVSFILPY